MPYIPNSPQLFLILIVFYGITDSTGKITGKADFNESISSARLMKLSQDCDAFIVVFYSASSKILPSPFPLHSLIYVKTKLFSVLKFSSFQSDYYRFVYRSRITSIFSLRLKKTAIFFFSLLFPMFSFNPLPLHFFLFPSNRFRMSVSEFCRFLTE